MVSLPGAAQVAAPTEPPQRGHPREYPGRPGRLFPRAAYEKELDFFRLRPALHRPKSVEQTVVLPEEAAAALQALAYERGESLEAVISRALEAYVSRPE